jgi:hypothetical protein
MILLLTKTELGIDVFVLELDTIEFACILYQGGKYGCSRWDERKEGLQSRYGIGSLCIERGLIR